MQRQKLPVVIFLQKLQILMPNAKCDVRPYDGNQHIVDHPVIRGSMLINWHPDLGECPSLETIEAVTAEAITAKENADRKIARDNQYRNDLSMKAAFRIERRANPALTFSQFLDELEAS